MIKKAEDKPYITLVCEPYEHESSVNTRITIEVMEKDLDRDAVISVCENFIKTMGYHFEPNEHLDIVTDWSSSE